MQANSYVIVIPASPEPLNTETVERKGNICKKLIISRKKRAI